jgi:hypothetical protein
MAGYASPTNRSEPGNLPEGQSITLAPSQRIGGTAVAVDGKPLPGARVFLQSTSSTGGAGSSSPLMMSVIADSQGRWNAQVHPAEVTGLAAKIGEPGGTPFKFGAAAPLNPSAAKAGNAVVTVAPSK